MSVIGLSLVCVFVAGFCLGRVTSPRVTDWSHTPTVVEDEPVDVKRWRHAMPPDRYLKQFPAGPYAEHARRIVSSST